MLGSFLRQYLELPTKEKNVVCLGGGIGTSQVLKGLRSYSYDLTAIVSMADDGGSAGRLRRAFSVLPPGDLVNCLAALSDEESILRQLFLYRFAGKRYGKDTDLGGHKLGNLIFVALTDIFKGDATKALVEFSKIISSRGRVLPATLGDVNIWAKTKDGKKVYGEENIDLGRYHDGKTLKEVYLDPPNVKAYKAALDSLERSNAIIVGPGDLFSTVIPVLIVDQIKKLLTSTTATKILIINIANKPFETTGFTASDYTKTIKNHLGKDIFDKIIINTNHSPQIPKALKYKYVQNDLKQKGVDFGKIIEGDFVDTSFPLYHNSNKIAQALQLILE